MGNITTACVLLKTKNASNWAYMQVTGAKNPSDRAGVHVEKLIS